MRSSHHLAEGPKAYLLAPEGAAARRGASRNSPPISRRCAGLGKDDAGDTFFQTRRREVEEGAQLERRQIAGGANQADRGGRRLEVLKRDGERARAHGVDRLVREDA